MNLSKQKQVFGSYAKDYQKYRRYYNTKLYKLLSSIIKKQFASKELSILDVGCGTGKSTVPLLKIGNRNKIFGVDPDTRMLKEAKVQTKKEHLPISYVEGNVESLPFKKESFDVLTVGTAFHWFATKKTLKEIQRVLKKNGLVFVYWSMERKDNPPTIGRELYKKFVWKAVPQKLRDIKHIKKLFMNSNLSSVKTTTIPFESKYTVEQYVGGLKTSSMYALMSTSQKKGFSESMFKAFKKEVRGKYYKIKSEMLVCYGFKKA
jgi:ubiquinone/menaquinone biosynthesis C-methylase UbiE